LYEILLHMEINEMITTLYYIQKNRNENKLASWKKVLKLGLIYQLKLYVPVHTV
jgi:hypothetical protein